MCSSVEFYESMPDLRLTVRIIIVDEKFLIGIIDEFLLFKIYIWENAWIDKSFILHHRQRYITDEYNTYELRAFILESFKIHVF